MHAYIYVCIRSCANVKTFLAYLFKKIDNVNKNFSGNPSKVIQDRIALVERHFGEICQSVGGYVRTLAKLRNKGKHRSMSS